MRASVPIVALLAALVTLKAAAVPPSTTATTAQLQQAQTLAKPVLRGNASDTAFVGYVKGLHMAGDSNILGVLFYVFRESINEQSEDKKYFLKKLHAYNELGKELSEYLDELNQASRNSTGRSSALSDPLLHYANALAVLERILASHRDLNADDRRVLQSLAAQDRQFVTIAKSLEQQVRTIALSPRSSPPPPPPPPVRSARPTGSTGRPPP